MPKALGFVHNPKSDAGLNQDITAARLCERKARLDGGRGAIEDRTEADRQMGLSQLSP